ncbi:profilin-1-like [Erpetoichthys calabaricus]|uniref:Profilin n=1 Tax=Erpetoichthys calabaricus TaxID=27687 RepID=A0A8C4S7T8_ERPCA|nr:profilin-1-like [Erpetoichthys calabaricus]
MSWNSYVDNMMADGQCQDAAIAGYKDNPGVWAKVDGGSFEHISKADIDALLCKDTSHMFTNGLNLGKDRCSALRHNFETDSTLDLRTKSKDGGPTYNITVGKGVQCLVFAKGKEGVHGGVVNKKVYDMIVYLKKSGY